MCSVRRAVSFCHKGRIVLLPKIISRTSVVEVIARALQQLAADLDAQLPKNLEAGAAEAFFKRVEGVLEQHEAFVLFRLMADRRVECADCQTVVGYSRASGAFCPACAQRRRVASQRTPAA